MDRRRAGDPPPLWRDASRAAADLGLVSPNGGDERLGLAVHVANGAAFGVAFSRLGGYGIGRAVLAAQAENAILWPGMAVADRVHPDARSGAWPSLLTDRGTIVQEIGGHLVFGVVLGVLAPRPR